MLRHQKRKEQIKPKASRKKETIKIAVEITKIDNKKVIWENQENKNVGSLRRPRKLTNF